MQERPIIIEGQVVPNEDYDDFDFASNSQAGSTAGTMAGSAGAIELVRNLISAGQITPAQAHNIRVLLTGGATMASTKWLSAIIGETPAAVVGAFVGSWLSKKIVR